MDPKAYLEMADTEERHWWFMGRRAILKSVIGTFGLPPEASILEVGSGTGGNLEMLAEFGAVKAMEMDPAARAIALRKTSGRFDVQYGRCPDEIAFVDHRFNLICMFDVLEHIDADVQTLAALKGSLARDGRMLITVPAFQWLWSVHDEFLHHKRRYSAAQLAKTITAAGLRLERLSYFNTLLFPLAVAARLQDRILRRRGASGVAMPGAYVNSMLHRVFGAEHLLLKKMNLPFGVSLLAVLRAG